MNREYLAEVIRANQESVRGESSRRISDAFLALV